MSMHPYWRRMCPCFDALRMRLCRSQCTTMLSPSAAFTTSGTKRDKPWKGSAANVLRDRLRDCGPHGIPFHQLEDALRQSLTDIPERPGDDADIAAAWREVGTSYYVARSEDGGEQRIVPIEWECVMKEVASELPYEGVTEPQMLQRLQKRLPHLQHQDSAALAGAKSWAAWVGEHCGSIVVTRSALTGEPLFYAADRNNVMLSSPSVPDRSTGKQEVAMVMAMHHALHMLGRGKQLPLFTEVDMLAPLLPTCVCPKDGEWLDLLSMPLVREHFDVEASIKVRVSSRMPPTLVIVDATTLGPSEMKSMLEAQATSRRPIVVKVLRRSGEATDVPSGSQQIIVDDLLEPAHMLGAVIGTSDTSVPNPEAVASEAVIPTEKNGSAAGGVVPDTEAQNTQRIVVLCGEAGRESLLACLQEVKQPSQRLQLCVWGADPLEV